MGVRVTKKTRSGSRKPKTKKEILRDIKKAKKAKLGMTSAKKKKTRNKTKRQKPVYFHYYIYIDGTEQRDMWDEDGKKGDYIQKILDKKYEVDYDDIHAGYVLITFKPSDYIPNKINIPNNRLFGSKKCVLKKGDQFNF